MPETPWVRLLLEEVTGALIVHAEGEIDLGNVDKFEQDLVQSATGKQEHAHVILTLADVHYFGAAGLSAIEASHQQLRRHGQELLIVAHPRSLARRVVDLAGLGHRINVLDSVAAAVDFAQKREGLKAPSAEQGSDPNGDTQTTTIGQGTA